MKASIIAIGNEILVGQVQDTNSAWIAERLRAAGAPLTNIFAVGDTAEALREILSFLDGRADLVIMTGGLGPTSDDITRKILSSYFDAELVFCPEAEQDMVQFLMRRGKGDIDISSANRTQAYVLKGATVLRNPIGTAPGMWLERNGTVFVSLPGVPFEMKALMSSQVLPMIESRFCLSVIHQRTVLVHGISESELAERIVEWEAGLKRDEVSLAYLPSPGLVRLRLTATGDDRERLESRIDRAVFELNDILGDAIFGMDDDTLEKKVGELLLERGLTAATAESCTGGAVAARITRVPGASAYFKGSVVAYSNEVKTDVLNVPKDLLDTRGAVSRETVETMAGNVLDTMGVDCSVAVSGIAGPGGGTEEKPVGSVWIAAASKDRVMSRMFQFGERRRDTNIARTVMTALGMLRKLLIEDSSRVGSSD